jgi:hypothetical protein
MANTPTPAPAPPPNPAPPQQPQPGQPPARPAPAQPGQPQHAAAHQQLTAAGCPPNVAAELSQHAGAEQAVAALSAAGLVGKVDWQKMLDLVRTYGPIVFDMLVKLFGGAAA